MEPSEAGRRTCYTRGVRHPRDLELFPHDRREITVVALVVVAVGGMIGAAARWGAGELWPPVADEWSWDILVVNVVGSLLIGFAARSLVIGTLSADFAITGVLGGFTTFSTFAVGVNDLLDAGRPAIAALYATTTLVVGITAAGVAGSARAREERTV